MLPILLPLKALGLYSFLKPTQLPGEYGRCLKKIVTLKVLLVYSKSCLRCKVVGSGLRIPSCGKCILRCGHILLLKVKYSEYFVFYRNLNQNPNCKTKKDPIVAGSKQKNKNLYIFICDAIKLNESFVRYRNLEKLAKTCQKEWHIQKNLFL